MLVFSGPARKRPRPLEEAVETGDGVALKFSDSFASDNQNLVLLQVLFLCVRCLLLKADQVKHVSGAELLAHIEYASHW